MPDLRGRLLAGQSLADLAWFRVGGPAEALFSPADEDDLAYFLARLPADMPVYPIGLGSNLLVRDGGMPGVVIRLGRGVRGDRAADGARIRVGAAAADKRSRSRRTRPGSAASRSTAAFPARSAARCA